MTVTIKTIHGESGNIYEVSQDKYSTAYRAGMYTPCGAMYRTDRELCYGTLKAAEATIKRWAKKYN